MSENLRTYTRALYGFDATVVRAEPTAWDNPSPCEGWKAIDVLAHNIGMNNMIAGFTNGVDARRPTEERPADPVAAWQESLSALLAALDSKGALQTVAKTPWGEMPVEKFLGFAWVDPVIHTWDLATATGQPPVLDEDLCARGAKQFERAGDSLRGENTFGPAVEVADDAPVTDRFMGLAGRDPVAG